MKKQQHYQSPGMSWDAGEIPCCDYCGRSAKKIQLFETAISGGICCDRDECKLKLAEDCIDGSIDLTDED